MNKKIEIKREMYVCVKNFLNGLQFVSKFNKYLNKNVK